MQVFTVKCNNNQKCIYNLSKPYNLLEDDWIYEPLSLTQTQQYALYVKWLIKSKPVSTEISFLYIVTIVHLSLATAIQGIREIIVVVLQNKEIHVIYQVISHIIE